MQRAPTTAKTPEVAHRSLSLQKIEGTLPLLPFRFLRYSFPVASDCAEERLFDSLPLCRIALSGMYGVRGHAQADRNAIAFMHNADRTQDVAGSGQRQRSAAMQWGASAGKDDGLRTTSTDPDLVTPERAHRRDVGEVSAGCREAEAAHRRKTPASDVPQGLAGVELNRREAHTTESRGVPSGVAGSGDDLNVGATGMVGGGGQAQLQERERERDGNVRVLKHMADVKERVALLEDEVQRLEQAERERVSLYHLDQLALPGAGWRGAWAVMHEGGGQRADGAPLPLRVLCVLAPLCVLAAGSHAPRAGEGYARQEGRG